MERARLAAALSRLVRPGHDCRLLAGAALALLACAAGVRGEPRSLTSRLFSSETDGWPARDVRSESSEGEEEFETDRDSFTPSTSTVLRSKTMIETAWTFLDNRDVADTNSLPELVIRHGLTDWLELRFGANYDAGGERNTASTGAGDSEPDEAPGFEETTQVSYGFKAFLTDQNGWVPESALIVMGNTPVTGPGHSTQAVFTYAWGWTFENGWKWDSALRYAVATEDGERHNQWAPSTVLKVPVGKGWDVHAEYFSILSEGAGEELRAHYLSPGVSWKIVENVELGWRVGWGLTDDSSRFFSNVGVAWLF